MVFYENEASSAHDSNNLTSVSPRQQLEKCFMDISYSLLQNSSMKYTLVTLLLYGVKEFESCINMETLWKFWDWMITIKWRLSNKRSMVSGWAIMKIILTASSSTWHCHLIFLLWVCTEYKEFGGTAWIYAQVPAVLPPLQCRWENNEKSKLILLW